MALRAGLVLAVAMIAAMLMVAHSKDLSVDLRFDMEPDGHGIVEDALELDEDLMMESESARRQLRGHRYISYAAMRRNSVPCNRRGNSYYSNCQSRQRANPYRRGCTRATRCARTNR